MRLVTGVGTSWFCLAEYGIIVYSKTMYAIKARFNGAVIIPTETIPVKGPYEAIVTFTSPSEPAKTIDDLDEFFGCFKEHSPWNGDSAEIIRKIRDEW